MVFRGEHDRRSDQASLGPSRFDGRCPHQPSLQQSSAHSMGVLSPKTSIRVRRWHHSEKEVCLCRLDSRFLYGRERRAGVLPVCRAPNLAEAGRRVPWDENMTTSM